MLTMLDVQVCQMLIMKTDPHRHCGRSLVIPSLKRFFFMSIVSIKAILCPRLYVREDPYPGEFCYMTLFLFSPCFPAWKITTRHCDSGEKLGGTECGIVSMSFLPRRTRPCLWQMAALFHYHLQFQSCGMNLHYFPLLLCNFYLIPQLIHISAKLEREMGKWKDVEYTGHQDSGILLGTLCCNDLCSCPVFITTVKVP